MRTAPVGPAAPGQPCLPWPTAWTGNPPQTAIDRKPLQTDKLTGRAFDDEVYAVVAQIPAGKIVSYKQIARLIGMPDHARRVGRAMASAPAELPCHRVVNSAGRTAPGWPQQRNCSKRKAFASKANGCADVVRFMWGGNPVTRIAPAPRPEPASGAATGRAPGTPPGRSFAPPAGHDRPAGRGNISPEKNLAFRAKTVIFATPAVRDGQYSPPGMRLPGKSTA